MIRLDALREMIIEARHNEATVRPFPSGVAAGDNRTGFLNASEAGRCTRWLWYDKHDVAGEARHPYGPPASRVLKDASSTPAPSKGG